MARIPLPSLDEMDDAVRAQVEAREQAGLLGVPRMAAYQPEMAAAMTALGRAIATHGTLPPRLVELVRLRIAFHNQCRTCMAIRYSSALDDGLTEDTVCSLERPEEADDLSAAERAAIRFGELFATNHLAIDDAVYDGMRAHFTDAQLVELGYLCALCVGFGRLNATWDVDEYLPAGLERTGSDAVTPWGLAEPRVVSGSAGAATPAPAPSA
jgi:AhpD family alkylhydroperoxidase